MAFRLICVNLCLLGIVAVVVNSQEASLIKYTVTEESAPTTIGNLIRDSTLKQLGVDVLPTLKFSFLQQEDSSSALVNSLFSISGNGDLMTKSQIDREEFCAKLTECNLLLDIQVEPIAYFRILKVQVTVIDINDKVPKFPVELIRLSLSEASVVGSVLTLPQAEDTDSPTFGVKSYSLTNTPPEFELKVKQNGDGSQVVNLIQKLPLDREQKASYTLQIVAVDGGISPKSGSASVLIEVIDVNDNPTVFEQENYEVIIQENVQKDSRILRVRASDADSSGSSGLLYGFSDQSLKEYGHIFKMENTTGYIIVAGPLNYEDKNEYVMDVTAQDRTPGAIPTVAKVTIKILDVNDNAPKIKVNSLTSTGYAEISEGATKGSFVAHITISDADSGKNGEFQCLLNSDLFSLEQLYPTEFKLITQVTFNREAQTDYQVALSCTDKGSPPMSTSRVIPITILDENDNAPVFTMSSYSARVLENTPAGLLVAQVTARDADFGDNAFIKYSIDANSQGYFSIDETSGNITTRDIIDHEKTPQFQVRVFARDQGSPSQSATVTVTVDVIDEDDEVPLFLQDQYTFVVHENEPANTEVGSVEAIDRDSEPFSNFKYAIEAPGNGFSINEYTGMIYTTQVLDREIVSVYYTTVLAIAQGQRSHTSSASVTIYVADKNDNAPIIVFPTAQNDTVYIPSNLPQGEAVTQIQAKDGDSGANAHLLYKIQSGNEMGKFVMDTASGYIFVGSSMGSKEDTALFKLRILVQDSGSPPQTAETTLNVIVNKSLPLTRDDLVPQENLTIVIVIACMSGLLVVILVIAIVAIVRQQRNKNSQRYNNMHNGLNSVVIEPSVKDTSDDADNLNNECLSTAYPHRKRNNSSGSKRNPKCYSYDTSKTADMEIDDGERRKKKEVSFAVNEALDTGDESIKLRQPLSIQTGHLDQDLPAEDRDSGCSMDTSQADSGQGSAGEDIHPFEHLNHHHPSHHPRLAPREPPPAYNQLHHQHHRRSSHDASIKRHNSPVIRTQGLKVGGYASSGAHRNSFHGKEAEKPALPPRENRKPGRDISQMFTREVLYKDVPNRTHNNSKNVCRVHGLPSKQNPRHNQSYNGSSNSVNLQEISTEVTV